MSIIAVMSPSLARSKARMDRFRWVSEIADDCLNPAEQDSGISIITAAGGTVSTIGAGPPYDVRRIGLVSMGTGSTSSGSAALGCRGNAFVLGTHVVEMETEISIPTLSTSGQRFTVFAGFVSDIASIAPANGFLFRYSDDIDGGRWQTWAQIGGAGAATENTGISVDAAVWYRLRMRLGAPAHVMQCWVNDVEVNVPLDGDEYPGDGSHSYSFIVQIRKSVGSTARTCSVDWVWMLAGSHRSVLPQ